MKTYNIGFINSNDLLPEVTQFDIEEKESVTEMMVELINLFSGFLKEIILTSGILNILKKCERII